MSEQAPSTGSQVATPKSSHADFLSKAEAAISSIHEGTSDDVADVAEEEAELSLTADDSDATDVDAEEAEQDEDDGMSPGSLNNPYTIKTLPDAHVTIKEDGELRTVSLREMVEGHMRENVFHKRINEANELKTKAAAVIEKAQEERSKLQSSLRDLIEAPEELYAFLSDHAEATLDKVARMRLQKMMEWQKNPQAKHEYDRQRQEAKLRKEADKFAREREEWNRTRSETEAAERTRKELEPGYQAGLKEAGYPKITDEMRVMIRGILNAKREQTGKPWTADDMRDAIVRAARITKAETVKDRKPAPPKAPPAGQKRPTQAVAKPTKASFRDYWKSVGK